MSRFSAFTDFFGEIVGDIRHKVVEQGWFGREVTDTPAQPVCPPSFEPPVNPAMEESAYAWAAWKEAHEMQAVCDARERDGQAPDPGAPSAPQQGYDLDR